MFPDTIVKRWKQTKCPPMDEWISKVWYKHTGYDAAGRRKFLRTFLQEIMGYLSQDKYL
jgi:hypothetical protein